MYDDLLADTVQFLQLFQDSFPWQDRVWCQGYCGKVFFLVELQ